MASAAGRTTAARQGGLLAITPDPAIIRLVCRDPLEADRIRLSRSLPAAVGDTRALMFGKAVAFALSGQMRTQHAMHCEAAALIAERLDMPGAVRVGIVQAYERWDGRGWPGAEREQIPLASRIAQFAEFVEVAHRLGGTDAAVALAQGRSGTQFDPAVAAVLCDDPAAILGGLDAIGTWDAVIAAEPALAVMLSGERFDAALLAIANFVDLKSPYISGHSGAVADLAILHNTVYNETVPYGALVLMGSSTEQMARFRFADNLTATASNW